MDNSTDKQIMPESISLFQALEVHHEQDKESKEKLSRGKVPILVLDTWLTVHYGQTGIDEDLVCLRSVGLTMILGAFLLLMTISISTSICYCLKMRRIKCMQRSLSPLFHQYSNSPDCSTSSQRSLKSSLSISDCSVLTDSRNGRKSHYLNRYG